MLTQRASVATAQGLASPTSSSSQARSQQGTSGPRTPVLLDSPPRGHTGGENLGDSERVTLTRSASGAMRRQLCRQPLVLSTRHGILTPARGATAGNLKEKGEPATIVWVLSSLPACVLLPWYSPRPADPAALTTKLSLPAGGINVHGEKPPGDTS